MNKNIPAMLLVTSGLCAAIAGIIFILSNNVLAYGVSMNASVVLWAAAFIMKE